MDALRERSGPEEPLFGDSVPTRSGNRFFTELKVGLGDWASDFKMLVGWNFRR